MKQCPQCRETYSDDSLNFCLNDGTPLSVVSDAATAVFPGGTISTAPTTQINYVPTQMAGGVPTAFEPPRKKSKAWIWVLLILGAVALLCGGGLVGLFILGSRSQSVANVSTYTPPASVTPDADPSPFLSSKGEYDLTMAKYNQIKDSTTRKEAEQILGGPGNELSNMNVMGKTYATVQWEGDNYSSVIISFENDKITFRSQAGLK